MNDYFLKKLIQQRHEQILTEVRAARLSRLGRFRVTRGKRKVRQFTLYLSRLKRTMFFQTPVADKGKSA